MRRHRAAVAWTMPDRDRQGGRTPLQNSHGGAGAPGEKFAAWHSGRAVLQGTVGCD